MRTPSISTSVRPAPAPRRLTVVAAPIPPLSTTSTPATSRSTSATLRVPNLAMSAAGMTVTDEPVWPIGSGTRSGVMTMSGSSSTGVSPKDGDNGAAAINPPSAAPSAVSRTMAPPAVPPTAAKVQDDRRPVSWLAGCRPSPPSQDTGPSGSMEKSYPPTVAGAATAWVLNEPHRVPVDLKLAPQVAVDDDLVTGFEKSAQATACAAVSYFASVSF